jgi:hypothetical protein
MDTPSLRTTTTNSRGLRAAGIFDPEDDPSVLVEAATSARSRFFFRFVPEGRRALAMILWSVGAPGWMSYMDFGS